MTKLVKREYVVYCIRIHGVIRYIGRTNCPIRRQLQHRNDFKKMTNKLLFINIIHHYPDFRSDDIILEIIKSFKSEVEAKRFECYLILGDYFKDKNLWQKVPNITDGW